MANKVLDGTYHEIPDEIMEHLNTLHQKHIQKDGVTGLDGVKRLNDLITKKTISFEQLKRIKNYFKVTDPNAIDQNKRLEYELNGGDVMKQWVSAKLDEITGKVHSDKVAGVNAGRDNMFKVSDHNDLGAPTVGGVDTSSNVAELPKMMGGLMEQINKIKHLIKVI